MRFVKGLTNSTLTYISNMIHICHNTEKGRDTDTKRERREKEKYRE